VIFLKKLSLILLLILFYSVQSCSADKIYSDNSSILGDFAGCNVLDFKYLNETNEAYFLIDNTHNYTIAATFGGCGVGTVLPLKPGVNEYYLQDIEVDVNPQNREETVHFMISATNREASSGFLSTNEESIFLSKEVSPARPMNSQEKNELILFVLDLAALLLIILVASGVLGVGYLILLVLGVVTLDFPKDDDGSISGAFAIGGLLGMFLMAMGLVTLKGAGLDTDEGNEKIDAFIEKLNKFALKIRNKFKRGD